MATDLEIRMLDIAAQMTPRFVESEGRWAVAWDNEFGREIERFNTRDEAAAFCRAALSDTHNARTAEDRS